MSLQEKFDAAVAIIQKLPKSGPLSSSNDEKLKFYSLFKQATIGNVNTERPGMFSFIEKAKWDAWKAVEDVSKEDAMLRYIAAVNESFDNAATQVNVEEWLSGDDLDPSIKANLVIISSK